MMICATAKQSLRKVTVIFTGIVGLVASLSLSAQEAVQQSAATPEVGKHVTGNMDATSMIISLIMVLGLIIASALVLKRFQPQAGFGKGLKIITSLHLGAKEKLVVVQAGEQQMLLGVTAHNVSLIQVLDKPLAADAPINNEFSQQISKFLNRNKASADANTTNSSNLNIKNNN